MLCIGGRSNMPNCFSQAAGDLLVGRPYHVCSAMISSGSASRSGSAHEIAQEFLLKNQCIDKVDKNKNS